MANNMNMELKKVNRNNIYRIISKKERITKLNIAYELNLSFPTVSQNLIELKEMGLIEYNGTFDSTGGRKAKGISCINTARVAFGLDITKNHLCLVLVDLCGKVMDTVRKRILFEDKESYYSVIQEMIEQLIQNNNITDSSVLGVGITMPAIISEDRNKINYYFIFEIPAGFYENLSKYIRFPYSLFNDANGGGFAELWNRNKKQNIIYLSLSYSVGGAILLNDEIYYGENQKSAEFGHMTLIPDGRQCYCGKKGCVDAYCASHRLSDMNGGKLGEFFNCLDQKSSEHMKQWNEYLYYLAVTVNNLRMFFDCDVVLGGYVGSYMNKYIDDLRQLVSERDTFEKGGMYIKSSNYPFEASAVGGALLYIDSFIRKI